MLRFLMEGAIIPRAEEEFAEYESQKKKRGRSTSIVWEHFDKLKDEVDDVWKTQCKHCKQIYSSAQKNGTSHLKRHMDRCPVIRASGLSFSSMSTLAANDGHIGYDSSIKRTRSISKVWEDFEKLKAERDDILKARCIHCKQILAGASKHGTSHLKRHLERCPKRRNHDVRQLLLSSEVRSIKQLFSSNEALVDGAPLKKCTIDQNEVLKAISTFILCGKHPVTVVEEFGFRHMMSVACPEFENVSVHAIRREIVFSYLKERDSMKERLRNAPGRVCLTRENWISEYRKDEYMCLTAHFIDKEWKLVKKIIRFKALAPPLNGTSIANEIVLCLNSWNLDTKMFSITSDNTSYDDDDTVNSHKGSLFLKKNPFISDSFSHVRCCCQLLNHIVKSSLNTVDDVLDKIRSGVEHIRKFASRKRKFYLIAAKEYQLDTKKRLRPDACCRWNTTYLMLERALYYKSAIQAWGEQDRNFAYCNLSDEEWEKMAMIQKFLAVFYDVEFTFSSTKQPTSNLYFRALWKVHMHLLKAVRGPCNFMTSVATSMQEKFEKYWTMYNLILSCAAVLDPRYKVKLVEFCYTKIYGEKAEDFVNNTVRTLYSLFDEYKPNSMSSSCNLISSDATVAGHDHADDEFEDYEQFLSRKSRPQDEKSQLDLYLEEPGLDLNSDTNVLDYWSNSSMRYPELAVMARDILAMPISSVAPEASFNIGTKTFNPGQISLNPKLIQALVCLSDWMYSGLDKSSDTSFPILHEYGDPSVSDEEIDYDDWDIEEGAFS